MIEELIKRRSFLSTCLAGLAVISPLRLIPEKPKNNLVRICKFTGRWVTTPENEEISMPEETIKEYKISSCPMVPDDCKFIPYFVSVPSDDPTEKPENVVKLCVQHPGQAYPGKPVLAMTKDQAKLLILRLQGMLDDA